MSKTRTALVAALAILYAMAAVALRAVDQRNPDGAKPLTGGSK